MYCLREPGMALVSLLSVALSSISGKAVAVYINRCRQTPLKIKVVLDKGYTSEWTKKVDLGE